MSDFTRTDTLDSSETRNEILVEIHNRLSEISKFMEIGIAIFAKLSASSLEDIKQDGDVSVSYGHVDPETMTLGYQVIHHSNRPIGYDDDMGGLYGSEDLEDGCSRCYPLGENTKALQTDEYGFFPDNWKENEHE